MQERCEGNMKWPGVVFYTCALSALTVISITKKEIHVLIKPVNPALSCCDTPLPRTRCHTAILASLGFIADVVASPCSGAHSHDNATPGPPSSSLFVESEASWICAMHTPIFQEASEWRSGHSCQGINIRATGSGPVALSLCHLLLFHWLFGSLIISG